MDVQRALASPSGKRRNENVWNLIPSSLTIYRGSSQTASEIMDQLHAHPEISSWKRKSQARQSIDEAIVAYNAHLQSRLRTAINKE